MKRRRIVRWPSPALAFAGRRLRGPAAHGSIVSGLSCGRNGRAGRALGSGACDCFRASIDRSIFFGDRRIILREESAAIRSTPLPLTAHWKLRRHPPDCGDLRLRDDVADLGFFSGSPCL